MCAAAAAAELAAKSELPSEPEPPFGVAPGRLGKNVCWVAAGCIALLPPGPTTVRVAIGGGKRKEVRKSMQEWVVWSAITVVTLPMRSY